MVGSGIAGLTAALAAAPRPTVLVSRQPDGSDTATALAQGGIAAALAPGDTPLDHARDTLVAGRGCNDVAAVSLLVAGARDAIAWLQSIGVRFDTDARGRQFAREGGHSCARVLHAGGDASGRNFLQALLTCAGRAGHIEHRPCLDVDSLLMRNGRVAGIGARDDSGRYVEIEGCAVVLATGGIGGLFARTSNPLEAQGSGLALGQAVGAALRDMDRVQFHPTAMSPTVASGSRLPLLTEALRGAGAILRDDRGHAFMHGVHPLADLAPRDVVACRMSQLQQQGRTLFLDATTLDVDWRTQFPTVQLSCLAAGIDPRGEQIPVTPAAHFHMGGLATDLDGATSVPGLYAVGEVACNGVHGANRLASNSLLEAVVFGRRLATNCLSLPRSAIAAGTTVRRERLPDARAEELELLRGWLWHGMGPMREASGLRLVRDQLIAGSSLLSRWQGRLALRLIDAALARRGHVGKSDSMPALPCQ